MNYQSVNGAWTAAPNFEHITQNFEWAIEWYDFDFKVIPLNADGLPAVEPDDWLDSLSSERIAEHWTENPDHKVGAVLDDTIVVLTAETPASRQALYDIAQQCGTRPLLRFDATGDWQHYYSLEVEGSANFTAAVPSDHVDRIGVYSGPQTIIALPMDAECLRCHVSDRNTLPEIGTEFVDLVVQHNMQHRADDVAPTPEHPIADVDLPAPIEAHDVENAPSITSPDAGPSALPSETPYPKNDKSHPLERYSLRGQSDEIGRELKEAIPILGDLVLRGQASALYAAPNTGKTAIVLCMIMKAIQKRHLAPDDVYYCNVDDTASGLVEKLWLAEEYGFHMLAEGYNGFKADNFLAILEKLIESGRASQAVIILDTLKKFVDLMSKAATRQFSTGVRRFIQKGGTVIALAHVNKKPGPDGKPIYAGTSDILDDFDCAYTIQVVPNQSDSGLRYVEFQNIKRRGNVLDRAAFSYVAARDISYMELLSSIQEVDPVQLEPLKQAAEYASDVEIIQAVTAAIRDGVNTKMKIRDAVAAAANVTTRTALAVIEKYTGDDPAQHRWNFRRISRGAQVYSLLVSQHDTPSDAEASQP